VTLLDDLERIAAAALTRAPERAIVSAVLAAEPASGIRRYVCAYEIQADTRAWIVLDDEGLPVTARRDVRDAVAIAALCELAEESAAGGDLDELLAQIVALRLTEAPAGVDEAEEAVRCLQHTIGSPPHLASPARLDAIGLATRRLERALDPVAPSPFTAAMQSAQGVVEALMHDVESTYRGELV
jgi:hypothetical protein